MKLNAYARSLGIRYETAYRWFKAGTIQGYQTPTGTIIITEEPKSLSTAVPVLKTAVYSRVSSSENKANLETQTQRLLDYCAARGYRVDEVVKEIGSGVNDSRPKLLKLLEDPSTGLIVVEHKDRLTRFGFNYVERLLAMQGRKIEVINLAESEREDLVQDFVSIITSFCARIYGQRRARRKTERIIAELEADEESDL